MGRDRGQCLECEGRVPRGAAGPGDARAVPPVLPDPTLETHQSPVQIGVVGVMDPQRDEAQ